MSNTINYQTLEYVKALLPNAVITDVQVMNKWLAVQLASGVLFKVENNPYGTAREANIVFRGNN